MRRLLSNTLNMEEETRGLGLGFYLYAVSSHQEPLLCGKLIQSRWGREKLTKYDHFLSLSDDIIYAV